MKIAHRADELNDLACVRGAHDTEESSSWVRGDQVSLLLARIKGDRQVAACSTCGKCSVNRRGAFPPIHGGMPERVAGRIEPETTGSIPG